MSAYSLRLSAGSPHDRRLGQHVPGCGKAEQDPAQAQARGVGPPEAERQAQEGAHGHAAHQQLDRRQLAHAPSMRPQTSPSTPWARRLCESFAGNEITGRFSSTASGDRRRGQGWTFNGGLPNVHVEELARGWLFLLSGDLSRYAIFAVATWFLLWIVLAQPAGRRRLRADRPPARQLVVEFPRLHPVGGDFSTVGLSLAVLDRAGLVWGPAVAEQLGAGVVLGVARPDDRGP